MMKRFITNVLVPQHTTCLFNLSLSSYTTTRLATSAVAIKSKKEHTYSNKQKKYNNKKDNHNINSNNDDKNQRPPQPQQQSPLHQTPRVKEEKKEDFIYKYGSKIESEQEIGKELLGFIQDRFKIDTSSTTNTEDFILAFTNFNSSITASGQLNLAANQKLMYFGKLCLGKTIQDSSSFQFEEDIHRLEFRRSVESSFFLRKRFVSLGLDQFVRFNLKKQQIKNIEYYQNHYYYQSMVKFLGALYLEFGYIKTSLFIHQFLLEQPTKPLESILLDMPNYTLIKRFAMYKLEHPIIETSAHLPLYETTIKSGRTVLQTGFGLTRDDSKYSCMELLNQQTNTLGETLSLILRKTKN
ncbi:hypothetical protein CYY_004085 [Polysphondylium violaceum]|uniref:RNase III domain-containing protein n=1 Tax=Polysphondylium violaceum TaxID=133409 RepID=A0A8J4PWR5_9MYCE|nr:hypothetical protein CYY_004085 [Polysphondylium violaceum]